MEYGNSIKKNMEYGIPWNSINGFLRAPRAQSYAEGVSSPLRRSPRRSALCFKSPAGGDKILSFTALNNDFPATFWCYYLQYEVAIRSTLRIAFLIGISWRLFWVDAILPGLYDDLDVKSDRDRIEKMLKEMAGEDVDLFEGGLWFEPFCEGYLLI